MGSYSQLQRFGLFDANVPRYTSYPPATAFGGTVTPEVYRGWLGQIPAGSRVSVYLHVPFCKRLCWFCAARTQGTRSDAPVKAYVETLLQEIATLRAALPEGVEAGSIHWGGGTPTLLRPEDIARLAQALTAAVPVARGAEISVEVDPNEIDGARMDALARMGMTRALIGVQDFDAEVQAVIGREQSYTVTRDAVEGLRARGITALNTDLLYGLPLQTRARIGASVQMLLSLDPDRVALFGYAHVPSMAKRQSLIPTEDLPAPEARLRLFETAQEILTWDGFAQIGIDHFVRPGDRLALAARQGRLRRGFPGYTDDSAPVLIGIGASAISSLPQGYAQNAAGTASYQRAVAGGGLATARGHRFRGEDRLRARMIEMLLCEFRIDAAALLEAGLGSEARIEALLDLVARRFEGPVRRSAEGLQVPPAARPLARMIARHLDGYEARAPGP